MEGGREGVGCDGDAEPGPPGEDTGLDMASALPVRAEGQSLDTSEQVPLPGATVEGCASPTRAVTIGGRSHQLVPLQQPHPDRSRGQPTGQDSSACDMQEAGHDVHADDVLHLQSQRRASAPEPIEPVPGPAGLPTETSRNGVDAESAPISAPGGAQVTSHVVR